MKIFIVVTFNLKFEWNYNIKYENWKCDTSLTFNMDMTLTFTISLYNGRI